MLVAISSLILAGSVLTRPSPQRSSFSSEGSYSIDLVRRSSTGNASDHEQGRIMLEAQMLSTCEKYGVKDKHLSRVKRASLPVSVELGALPRDFGYYASIQIGTPPVPYLLLMDTGSSDLVVLSSPCSIGCTLDTPLYAPLNSSTSVPVSASYAIQYGSGSGSGTIVTDTINFAGMSVVKQRIAAVSTAIGIAVAPNISGIAGLAWSSLSSNKFVPFLEKMFQEHKLASPVFGFALSKAGEHSNENTAGGIMNVGFLDDNLFVGDINYINSPSQIFWDIPLDEISVKSVNLGLGVGAVTIDTGSSNLYLPVKVADKIYAAISKSSRAVGSGLYVYPCLQPVNLAFHFGGQRYVISDTTFNLAPADNFGILCYGAVNSIPPTADGKDQYIIGDAFLRSVYVAFRFSPSAVGFALPADPNNPRRPNPTSTMVPITSSISSISRLTPSTTTLSALASARIAQNASSVIASGQTTDLSIYEKMQNIMNSQIANSVKSCAKLLDYISTKKQQR